jgi:hypothetical protein
VDQVVEQLSKNMSSEELEAARESLTGMVTDLEKTCFEVAQSGAVNSLGNQIVKLSNKALCAEAISSVLPHRCLWNNKQRKKRKNEKSVLMSFPPVCNYR